MKRRGFFPLVSVTLAIMPAVCKLLCVAMDRPGEWACRVKVIYKDDERSKRYTVDES